MCPLAAAPRGHLRQEWESIFANAFSATTNHQQCLSPLDIDLVENKVCGNALDPHFDGLHVWSNNVNTLSLSNNLADLHKLCCHFRTHNIDIAALQEVNIDLTQAKIFQKVKAVFDQHFNKQCILVCSTTNIWSETNWKPGSTLIVVMPQWAPYVMEKHRDKLGRWRSVTLQAKDHRQLFFYSFYNVCKNKIANAGRHTIYAQQWHILRRQGDVDPDPRIQYIQDLATELAVHKKHDRSICIVGDFNEGLGDDPALMASICRQFDLVDVMDILHPEDSHIPSYARSQNRLDYALVSRNLFPDIAYCDLNHYHEFFPSDHRAIFMGFAASIFGNLPAFVPAASRGVNSDSPNVATFIAAAYNHLDNTGTFVKLQKFTEATDTLSSAEITAQADTIDEQITRALLSAERKCQKPKQAPWLVALHEASLQVKYWRLTKAAANNGYDATPTLQAVNDLLPTELQQHPDPLCTTNMQLN
jgi:hypothetical protein